MGEEYEAALAAASPERPAVERSDDDRYIIYTGGTTGLPKGVEWRHVDAFYACMGGGDPSRLEGAVTRPDELPDRIMATPLTYLPLAPMMHAAAQWTSFAWFFAGSRVVLMAGPLDPDAVWRTIEAERVNLITVVGDAVARPLLDAWDQAGGYDASSLFNFSNGGAAMAPATRERIFATLPHVMVTDGFGSSEAGAQGAMRVAAGERREAPAWSGSTSPPSPPSWSTWTAAGRARLRHGRPVLAGGHLPVGYYTTRSAPRPPSSSGRTAAG